MSSPPLSNVRQRRSIISGVFVVAHSEISCVSQAHSVVAQAVVASAVPMLVRVERRQGPDRHHLYASAPLGRFSWSWLIRFDLTPASLATVVSLLKTVRLRKCAGARCWMSDPGIRVRHKPFVKIPALFAVRTAVNQALLG